MLRACRRLGCGKSLGVWVTGPPGSLALRQAWEATVARSFLHVAESWAAVRLFLRSWWGKLCIAVALVGAGSLTIDLLCARWVWLNIPFLRHGRGFTIAADGSVRATYETWLLLVGVELLNVGVFAGLISLAVLAARLVKKGAGAKQGEKTGG